MKKFFKRLLYFIFIIGILLALAGWYILNLPQFGKLPEGPRLERIKKSPHYKNGRFDNLNPTPQIAEDTSMPEVMFRFLTTKIPNKVPAQTLRFEKTDLKNLSPDENIFVWMGHSSYFLQLDGKKILVDPVFCGYSSPFSFSTKAFKGADIYTADDIPQLDYLLITHDHYDHLDYETIKKLDGKFNKVVTGLGTGSHLEYWGVDPAKIVELDWDESFSDDGWKINAEPARHFSGRGFKRDQTLWISFAVQTPTHQLFLSCDSGFDTHFAKIGQKYGGFDLCILEDGQYNKDWRYIHMMPGEQYKAMTGLKAKRMIPVHNSKFALAQHPWKEPLDQLYDHNTGHLRILFPKIGEKTFWEDDSKVYGKWWQNLK